ncbi:MAG: DUF2235 domain-containing protein [Pseudomonadota bacterium]
MKNIVILCDGTWNSPTLTTPTNVVKLDQACAKDAPDQVVAYLAGVGVNNFENFLRRWMNKLGGGAFGWGLGQNVRRAYQQLCLNYEPGDRIFIFGFSRGAYTARALGGMIRKCGIIPKDKVEGVNGALVLNRAWRLYKRIYKKLDEGPAWTQRKALSPDIATSEDDLKARGGKGTIVDIHFMGVWDTVGALGLPLSVLGPVAKLWNRKYQFYDTNLSSMVVNGYHAVALDEQRELFIQTDWNNIDVLNKGDTSDQRRYQQLWFVGNHGMIGGSNETREIVAYPQAWIIQKAVDLGLRLKPDAEIPDAPGDPTAFSKEIVDMTAKPIHAWRNGPEEPWKYHWSVGARMRGLGNGYNPGSARNRASIMNLPEPE